MIALVTLGNGLLSGLITLLVIAVFIYAAKVVLDMIPLPVPVKTIVILILGIVALIYFLHALGISV